MSGWQPSVSSDSGNVASGTADTGNPVKVGGRYNSTRPVLADGQRGDLQIDARGNLGISLLGANGVSPAAVLSSVDGIDTATSALTIIGLVSCFNGVSWDKRRGNVDTAALITAAGATVTQTGADQTNFNARGVKVVLNMTAVGTGSVTLAIQGKDAASGAYYTILTGAAVVTNSTNVYTVYPGATAIANVSASDILPRTWRVLVTANNANPTTYSVGASVVV